MQKTFHHSKLLTKIEQVYVPCKQHQHQQTILRSICEETGSSWTGFGRNTAKYISGLGDLDPRSFWVRQDLSGSWRIKILAYLNNRLQSLNLT